MSGRLETATWPAGTKTMLEIGIGTVLGAGLTRTSLEQLQLLWRPALLITLSLVLIWGMACIGAVIGFTICISALAYLGLLIWTIVEVCTIEVDGQGRRFRSG